MTEARQARRAQRLRIEVQPAALERMLTDAVLAGGGRGEVLRRLRDATGRHARLVSADGTPIASTDGGAGLPLRVAGEVLANRGGTCVETLDGWRASALPVRVGATVAGVLLTIGTIDPRVDQLAAAAVTALLIDSVRGTGVSEALASPSALVAALRYGTPAPAVRAVAERLGVDPAHPPAGAVLHYSGSRLRTWTTALSWLEHPVQQEHRTAWTVIADGRALAELQRRLVAMVGGTGDGCLVAASGSRPDCITGMARSFGEAARLLRLAQARGTPLLTFERCGVAQLLLPLPRTALEAYVELHLGPIRERPELMATLRAWLAAGGSRQSVSEQLHLHRNSVGYRVRQIKTLLGIDPLVPANSAELQTALAALDLMFADDGGSTGFTPPPIAEA